MNFIRCYKSFAKGEEPHQIGELMDVDFKGETKQWVIIALEHFMIVDDVLVIQYYLQNEHDTRFRDLKDHRGDMRDATFCRTLEWEDVNKYQANLNAGSIFINKEENDKPFRVTDVLKIQYIPNNEGKLELYFHYACIPLYLPLQENINKKKKEKQRQAMRRVK